MESESSITISAESTDSMTQGTTLSLLAEASQMWTFKVGMAVQRYYFPCIIAIGLVGNFLAFAVMVQKHNRRISCCVYMAALALSDNANLVIAAIYWGHTDAPPPAARPISWVTCKAFAFLFHAFQLNGVVLIVCMTLDRVIAIQFPLQAPSLCTTKRAKISIICILMCTMLFSIPYVLISEPIANGKVCVAFFNISYLSISRNIQSIFLVEYHTQLFSTIFDSGGSE